MTHLRRSAVMLPCLLLLAGCIAPPKTAERPAALVPPTAWAASGATKAAPVYPQADEARWLTSFNDATLAALANEALARNYDLQVVAQTFSSVREAAVIAGADKFPSLNLGLDGSKRQVVVESGSVATGVESRQHSLGLNVSWELDIWGRLRNREQAAIADLQAAEADLLAARLSLTGQVAKAWFRASTARLQLTLAEETTGIFEATADLVRNRYEAGISTSLELRLALANAATARGLIDQRRQELDTAVRSLEALLGRYPGNSLATIDALPPLTAMVPEGIPSTLLGRRPDILAADRRLAAADARFSESRKALLPTLRLTGSAGTASSELENLLDTDFEVWSIAAGLAQPLFQGGRLRAGARRSEALAERAHASYVATLLTAFREVETTLAAEDTLRRRETSLLEAATHSTGAERLARDEYEAGLADIITVLESQRRALDAQSAHLNAREQRLRNRVDLHLSLGGDFLAPTTSPFTHLPSATSGALAATR